jgi:hypothetical protein
LPSGGPFRAAQRLGLCRRWSLVTTVLCRSQHVRKRIAATGREGDGGWWGGAADSHRGDHEGSWQLVLLPPEDVRTGAVTLRKLQAKPGRTPNRHVQRPGRQE